VRKHLGPLFLLLLLAGLSAEAAAKAEPFRLHLIAEPSGLDPQRQKASVSSYLLQSLYRNLFFYDNDRGLVPDLGDSCKREGPLVLVCKLKKDLHWSDGSPITSADFLKTYRRLLDPQESFPRADLLFKIKNAAALYKGKKAGSLGITAPDDRTLRFEFAERDPDFEYNLGTTQLAPVKNILTSGQKATELVVSGPYKVADWAAGSKISLVTNSFYKFGSGDQRPPVEFLFIAEDGVALQLYEKNELSFLRRLPTSYIPKFKSRPDFLWIPVIRFDYLGFGPVLKDHPKLREALSLSLNFPELQKVYSAEGLPGCPGIPESWTTEQLCYKQDIAKAKAALALDKNTPQDLKLSYSSQGGEDHRRGTEWMQAQWSVVLGLKIQVVLKENKIYLNELQQNPPTIFRKGVAPDRPTCLATLETFAEGNPENYIQLKDPEYQGILKSLAEATQSKEQKKLCTQGVRYLMEHYVLIPTGPIHFAMLAKPEFKGWKLNSMNQLDLSSLEGKK
jgi:oligopeptide transport system substrate-binding protein